MSAVWPLLQWWLWSIALCVAHVCILRLFDAVNSVGWPQCCPPALFAMRSATTSATILHRNRVTLHNLRYTAVHFLPLLVARTAFLGMWLHVCGSSFGDLMGQGESRTQEWFLGEVLGGCAIWAFYMLDVRLMSTRARTIACQVAAVFVIVPSFAWMLTAGTQNLESRFHVWLWATMCSVVVPLSTVYNTWVQTPRPRPRVKVYVHTLAFHLCMFYLGLGGAVRFTFPLMRTMSIALHSLWMVSLVWEVHSTPVSHKLSLLAIRSNGADATAHAQPRASVLAAARQAQMRRSASERSALHSRNMNSMRAAAAIGRNMGQPKHVALHPDSHV